MSGISKTKQTQFEKQIDQSLPYLFTPWQIEIIRRRLADLHLTPAQRQELSRKIKPKINAIEALHGFRDLFTCFRGPTRSRR